MIAVDTNVLVRLFVADDELQATRAVRLFETEKSIFVSKTVVLEFVWVLSAVYSSSRAAIIQALETLAGLQQIELEDRAAVIERQRVVLDEGDRDGDVHSGG